MHTIDESVVYNKSFDDLCMAMSYTPRRLMDERHEFRVSCRGGWADVARPKWHFVGMSTPPGLAME